MSIVFALKLALVPCLIGGITLAGRRWGPTVAGWISAFPVMAAPILLFVCLEQGVPFASNAAAGTLAAVLAILVFGISYAWVATRSSWGVSLLLAFLCYAVAVVCLTLWAPSVFVAAPAVVAALLAARHLFPELPAVTGSSAPSNDVPWRMAAGASMVVFVTHFSSRLGPQLSGLLAMFPIMLSVLVVFSHRHLGANYAIRLLKGAVLGYYAFAAFCLTLSVLLPRLSIGVAFSASLMCASIVQVMSREYVVRTQQAVAADRG